MAIRLKHVSPRKMVAPGTNVGLALSALWYLGKSQVSADTFAAIKQRLSPSEYEQLIAAIPRMPGWMAAQLLKYEKELHV